MLMDCSSSQQKENAYLFNAFLYLDFRIASYKYLIFNCSAYRLARNMTDMMEKR